jgi:hypothetical protein
MRIARRVVPWAIALVVGATAFACDKTPTEITPTAGLQPSFSVAPAPKAKHAPPPTLCTNLPRVEVTQDVGPEGGTIYIGPHTLVIPAGALDRTVSITAISEPHRKELHVHRRGQPEEKGFIITSSIQFHPGLKFKTPASLTMSYANCDVAALADMGLVSPKIVYTNRYGNVILDVLPTTVDPSALTATAPIHHFSGYAVAW